MVKKDGLYQHWSDKGQKRIECYYLDGKLDGSYKSWWDKGQKWIECNYRNGKLDGLYTVVG